MAQREVVAAGLADPALVLGARGAQLADLAPLARREVVLGVLAAQERAPADVAGHVLLVGLDVCGLGHHRPASLATARRAFCSGSNAPPPPPPGAPSR